MHTETQRNAISRAQEVLRQAGLQFTDILIDHSSTNNSSLPFKPLLHYVTPRPILFTQDELEDGKGRITVKSGINAIVDHPPGAIVEFPETGDSMDMAIGHRFRICPEKFIHPKDNIQYSLGGTHGSHSDVRCFYLHDKDTSEAVACKRTKYNCLF